MIRIQQKLSQVEMPIIDYPVKLHNMKDCKCRRILSKIKEQLLEKNEKVAFVVEKIWHDEEYKDKIDFYFITIQSKDQSPNNALEYLFCKSKDSRGLVMDYFNQYTWSSNQSIKVREIVNQMTSISYCLNTTTINRMNYNAGFIIIGSKIQLEPISHCFNKLVTKTEFCKLSYVQIKNLSKIDQEIKGFTIKSFCNDSEYQTLADDTNNYTIVGLQSSQYLNGNTQKYNFPFGKREWSLAEPETPLQCAKRELYEEFNLQFSDKLWFNSVKQNRKQYIESYGFFLFYLYLPDSMSIQFHYPSQTIYLDILY